MPKRTKKKGGAANNAKVTEYTDKINNYIQHCTRLQKLYDKKHNEVKILTNYLLEIDRDFPNVPVNHQIVGEIIRAIDDLPAINTASQHLTDLDRVQDRLMAQAQNNRKVIYQKINELRSSSGKTPVAAPVDITVPVLPASGLAAPVLPATGLAAPVLPATGLAAPVLPASGLGVPIPPPQGPGGLPGYLASTGTRNLPNPGLPPYSTPGSAVFDGSIFLPETFFNMEKKDPFNLEDYQQHLKKISRNNFNFIPKENDRTPDNPNLYLNIYHHHSVNTNEEILNSLNRFINVNRYVITFQNAIVYLCKNHGRTQQEFNQVLKIPFENEAQTDYTLNPNQYYDLLINETSQLLGCLLKLEEMNLEQMYYHYKLLFDFLQLLISITPPGYKLEIQVSQEERDLIKAMPKEVLEDILVQLLDGNLIETEDLLKNRILSSEVIINYLVYLLNNPPKIERRRSANNVLPKKIPRSKTASV